MQERRLVPEGGCAVGAAEAVGAEREGLDLPAAAEGVRRGGCRPALAAGLAAALVLLAAAYGRAPQREPAARRPPLAVGLAAEAGLAGGSLAAGPAAAALAPPGGGGLQGAGALHDEGAGPERRPAEVLAPPRAAAASLGPLQTEVEVVVDVPAGQTKAGLEAQLASSKEVLEAKVAAALESAPPLREVATGPIGASTRTEASYDYSSMRMWLAIACTFGLTIPLVTFILFCIPKEDEKR